MKTIDLEIWEPDPEKKGYLRYAGQPVAREVFDELKEWLEASGFLPDEYFLLGMDWEKDRKIPKGADILCSTDYGGSEGVYVDVYLKWYEDGKPVTESFATGKTLGESGYDLDRMFLTASAITKAFHGEGWRPPENGIILDLDPEAKKALTEILANQEQRPELRGVMESLGIPVQQEQSASAPDGPRMEMTL